MSNSAAAGLVPAKYNFHGYITTRIRLAGMKPGAGFEICFGEVPLLAEV